jgi:vacuolar-type H+-ATPase subunit I/STV1
MGVLLQDGSRSVVVEGWIPDDEFEAAKRAFDAIVTSTTFGY